MYWQKKYYTPNKSDGNDKRQNFKFYAWLDYKRANKIVRYYPTYKQYLRYRYYCFANNLMPFGGLAPEEDGYNALLDALRERIS